MYLYLLILVCSIFLGTEILAIPTPVAQLTIYRLLSLSTVPLLVYQVSRPRQQLKIETNNTATNVLVCYLIWWFLAFSSILWVADLRGWFQHLFLMSIGMSSIIALYMWVSDLKMWKRLVTGAWVSITGLVVWGYLEIITNIYLFANVDKLDKYRTFSSQPMTRIPITTFENQNDFATLLLAYLALCLIMYYFSLSHWRRSLYVGSFLAASYLIYRSGSRLSLICLLLFLGIHALSYIKLDLKAKHYLASLAFGITGLVAIVTIRPSLISKVTSLFYFGGHLNDLSGDTIRMNLWRNGLIFVGQTAGFGVGLGNIEHWMLENAFWTTNGQELIVNMHNWWLEILVGHGVLAFILYVLAYGLMLIRLYQLGRRSSQAMARSAHTLFSFMVIFIFASITSANNMLIEWHWLFFGLIVSFIKVSDAKEKQNARQVKPKEANNSINHLKEKVYR